VQRLVLQGKNLEIALINLNTGVPALCIAHNAAGKKYVV